MGDSFIFSISQIFQQNFEKEKNISVCAMVVTEEA